MRLEEGGVEDQPLLQAELLQYIWLPLDDGIQAMVLNVMRTSMHRDQRIAGVGIALFTILTVELNIFSRLYIASLL